MRSETTRLIFAALSLEAQAGKDPFWRLPGPGAGVCFKEFDSKDRGAPARSTAYLWVNGAKQPPGPSRCGKQIQPQLPQRSDP